jgi:hypothetical protein
VRVEARTTNKQINALIDGYVTPALRGSVEVTIHSERRVSVISAVSD